MELLCLVIEGFLISKREIGLYQQQRSGHEKLNK